MKITGYLVPLLAVMGAILVGFSIPFIISGITSEGRRELVRLQASSTAEIAVATLNAIGAQTGQAFLQTIFTSTVPPATGTLAPSMTSTTGFAFIPLSGASSTPSNTPTATRTRWIPSLTPTNERHSDPPPGPVRTATPIPPTLTPVPPTPTDPPPPTKTDPPPNTEPPPPNTEPPPPNTEPPPPNTEPPPQNTEPPPQNTEPPPQNTEPPPPSQVPAGS